MAFGARSVDGAPACGGGRKNKEKVKGEGFRRTSISNLILFGFDFGFDLGFDLGFNLGFNLGFDLGLEFEFDVFTLLPGPASALKQLARCQFG